MVTQMVLIKLNGPQDGTKENECKKGTCEEEVGMSVGVGLSGVGGRCERVQVEVTRIHYVHVVK